MAAPAGALMLLLWIGTFALTVCPALHQLLHADAQSANHVCLVTQLKQQPLLATLDPVVLPLPIPESAELQRPADLTVPAGRDFRLSPSRAPPFLSAALRTGERGA